MAPAARPACSTSRRLSPTAFPRRTGCVGIGTPPAGLKLSRLSSDGVDHLIHTGHPRHAGKDDVHASVMLLHCSGGAAVPHHDAVVILVSSIPQTAFDHTGGG